MSHCRWTYRVMVAIGAGSTLAGACSGAGSVAPTDAAIEGEDPSAFACPVPPPTECPNPPPHYPDIAPIVQRLCVPCHAGLPNGPWPLTDYTHVADWQDIIRGAMLDCSMPPITAAFAMKADERAALLTWILCGFLP
jgi:hypothetical protein